MTDYRLVMRLLIQQHTYRHIERLTGSSHRTIAKASKICREHHFTTIESIDALTAEELDELFTDGRKVPSQHFVDFNVHDTVNKRLGKKKPPLRVLWANYLDIEPGPGQRHYSYQRFCQIVGEYVDVNDLTMRVQHVPGRTMQVDWPGTKMVLLDPITGTKTKVSIFVATMPYSGCVFARAYLDEKTPNWIDGHQRAFEFFDGVAQVIVPDNASTASNQIAPGDRARKVNPIYEDFLEYHHTAAVPTRVVAPQDKGGVESGVKVVTNWVIHKLADRVFTNIDDLNEAIDRDIITINDKTPFRGQHISRKQLFDQYEHGELLALPEVSWKPVTWRKSKVNRDYHIEIATVKYSVPYTYAGRKVDVKISGTDLTVMADDEIIASHTVSTRKHVFVTDADHVPERHQHSQDLWTAAYFLRQAHKVGPSTVAVITSVLNSRKIEAQSYRTCQNILGLGTGDNKLLLERTCAQLMDNTDQRAVSYTAVKQRMAALRAQAAGRPTTTPGATQQPESWAVDRRVARDTASAHLDGVDAFSLTELLGAQPPVSSTDEGQS